MITPYDYQQLAIADLLPILRDKSLALINGDVGVGKTVVALQLVKEAKPPAVGVIAPKIVLSSWVQTAKEIGVKLAFCSNPEILRTGRRPNIVEKLDPRNYQFNLPPGSVIIFDEVHRFGGFNAKGSTQTAYLMMGAKLSKCKVIGCTATLGESPLKFRGLLSLADQVKWNDFRRWALKHGCYRDHNINGSPWRFGRGKHAQEIMTEIHSMLFPEYGTRIRIADIPGYPECDHQIRMYSLSEEQQQRVNDIYEGMREEILRPDRAPNDLVQFLRHRQKVQQEKVILFSDITQSYLDQGCSVVAFFDFRDALKLYAEIMHLKLGYAISVIHGGQTKKGERDAEIARFQSNETRVLGAIGQAGGVGVSLGDEHGGHPRVGLINVPIDGNTMIQETGRVWRTTNKTTATNIVVLLAGVPVEERMNRLLKGKLRNLASVQGDDIKDCILG